jgi:hypothetical protein
VKISTQFLSAFALVGVSALPPVVRAQGRSVTTPAAVPSLQGVWTLIPGASDLGPPPGAANQGRQGGGGPGGAGGNGPLGPGRRGAQSPRPAPGTGPGGPGAPLDTNDPAAAARQQQQLTNLTTAPQRLTIVQNDSVIVITTDDGRTMRLAPTGKSIKEPNGRGERKTKWDSGKLVTEMTGPNGNTITERYWLETAANQLHEQMMLPGGRGGAPITLNRFYITDPAGVK